MEYYSALKKKEILSYATTWMNFKDIMLSEISQSQKDKYHRIPLKVDKFTDTKSRTVLVRYCREGVNRELFSFSYTK